MFLGLLFEVGVRVEQIRRFQFWFVDVGGEVTWGGRRTSLSRFRGANVIKKDPRPNFDFIQQPHDIRTSSNFNLKFAIFQSYQTIIRMTSTHGIVPIVEMDDEGMESETTVKSVNTQALLADVDCDHNASERVQHRPFRK